MKIRVMAKSRFSTSYRGGHDDAGSRGDLAYGLQPLRGHRRREKRQSLIFLYLGIKKRSSGFSEGLWAIYLTFVFGELTSCVSGWCVLFDGSPNSFFRASMITSVIDIPLFLLSPAQCRRKVKGTLIQRYSCFHPFWPP
jgi:hypothetical protein